MQKPRIGAHEVVEKLYETVGELEAGDPRTGTDTVAKFLGVGKTTAYKWSDPDQDGEISYARVRLLTEHFGVTAAAEDLCRLAGGEFVPIKVQHNATMPWCAKLGAIARQDGALHGIIGEALSDGNISAAEAKCIIGEIDSHMDQLRRLRARVEAEGGQNGAVVRMASSGR